MKRNIRITFLLIALVQGLHSIEEFIGKLWAIYPPATFICSLVSPDLKKGFIIINISLFIVLMLVWLGTFSKSFSTTGLLWFWAILEIINGTGHIIWATIEGSYEPGLATAPILLVLAIYLTKSLTKPITRETLNSF